MTVIRITVECLDYYIIVSTVTVHSDVYCGQSAETQIMHKVQNVSFFNKDNPVRIGYTLEDSSLPLMKGVCSLVVSVSFKSPVFYKESDMLFHTVPITAHPEVLLFLPY